MGSSFKTTRWTIILQAGDSDSDEGSAAFGELCRDYWRPVYAFVRRTGANHEDAEDLTQTFFQYLLENELPRDVHPAKGRFRNWLLAVLKNFLATDHRYRTRERRGGAALITVPIEEAHLEMPNPADSGESFDREWARCVLANALERLRDESHQAGQQQRFIVLRDCLFDDTRTGGATAGHAADLGVSHNAARIALSRLRQRYRELVRKEVSRLVEEPAEIDDEIEHLVRVLSR